MKVWKQIPYENFWLYRMRWRLHSLAQVEVTGPGCALEWHLELLRRRGQSTVDCQAYQSQQNYHLKKKWKKNNSSCLTAFVGWEANLLMYLQEPPRVDSASGRIHLLWSWQRWALCTVLWSFMLSDWSCLASFASHATKRTLTPYCRMICRQHSLPDTPQH